MIMYINPSCVTLTLFIHSHSMQKWNGNNTKQMNKYQHSYFNSYVIRCLMKFLAWNYILVITYNTISYVMIEILSKNTTKQETINWTSSTMSLTCVKLSFKEQYIHIHMEVRRREGIWTFYSSQLLAQCNKIPPFHVALPYESENLFSCKHWHPFQILPIDTIFFEYFTIVTKIYFFQPQPNILQSRVVQIENPSESCFIQQYLIPYTLFLIWLWPPPKDTHSRFYAQQSR